MKGNTYWLPPWWTVEWGEKLSISCSSRSVAFRTAVGPEFVEKVQRGVPGERLERLERTLAEKLAEMDVIARVQDRDHYESLDATHRSIVAGYSQFHEEAYRAGVIEAIGDTRVEVVADDEYSQVVEQLRRVGFELDVGDGTDGGDVVVCHTSDLDRRAASHERGRRADVPWLGVVEWGRNTAIGPFVIDDSLCDDCFLESDLAADLLDDEASRYPFASAVAASLVADELVRFACGLPPASIDHVLVYEGAGKDASRHPLEAAKHCDRHGVEERDDSGGQEADSWDPLASRPLAVQENTKYRPYMFERGTVKLDASEYTPDTSSKAVDSIESFDLPDPIEVADPLGATLRVRRSRRDFEPSPLSREEVATLLIGAAGMTDADAGFRAYPSAGARYPDHVYFIALETAYPDGAYYFDPTTESLELVESGDLTALLGEQLLYEDVVANSSAVIAITAEFPRIFAKYHRRGYRFALQESGHVSQNFYLVAEALGLGTCTIGSFLDDGMNSLLGLDDPHEQTISVMAMGRRSR